MNILQKARSFIVSSFHEQVNGYEIIHPWRKDWKYVVLHSLRVEQTVLKILSREHQPLPEAEIEILRLAAILHDLGKFIDRESHAQAGARIAEAWLRENIGCAETVARINDIIAAHANKMGQEPDYAKAVLQDADVLDEIGAMSIFMVGNWLDRTSPFYLEAIHARILDFEVPYCEEKMEVLNTSGAKEILQERRLFIQQFADQLIDELTVDSEIMELLRSL